MQRRVAYPVLPMFKAILLQRWYRLSDPGLEEALYDRISFVRFCGFSMSGERPDETTLCRFRNALLKEGLYQRLFKKLNQQLTAAGLIVQEGAIVDATLVASQRHPQRALELQPNDDEDASGPVARVVYSDDAEANWTIKANKPHYGYKTHTSVDAREGFILGGHVTPASRSDMKELEQVLEESDLPEKTAVLADKGYASAENRAMVKEWGFLDCIMWKAVKGKPLDEMEQEANRAISALRAQVERCFGTLKKDYGFHRARYVGKEKVELEFFLNAFCFNIKKAVRLAS